MRMGLFYFLFWFVFHRFEDGLPACQLTFRDLLLEMTLAGADLQLLV